ncbi:MAG: putative IclR family transcriptional regulator [Ilumatobacteraceae bacterium]|nr:putative IclR family transcriptional regulator [Ilumatobacteraceae bacterium]
MSSPPTARVLAVLDLLAASPEREFRLAEIVAALGLHKSTCHAIVTTMVARGYLARGAGTKGYTLGSAVIVAGRAAEHASPAVHQARSVVPALARDLDVECVASVIERDVIVVVEWAPPRSVARGAAMSAGASWSHIGQRIPLVAPFGSAQMAWCDDERLDAWIARSTVGREQLLSAMAVVRARGYDIQTGNSQLDTFRTTLASVDLDRLSDSSRAAVGQLMSELGRIDSLPEVLDSTIDYDINALAAPVFDGAAAPVLTVSLHPVGLLAGDAVMALGRCLRAAADEITASIGGSVPA